MEEVELPRAVRLDVEHELAALETEPRLDGRVCCGRCGNGHGCTRVKRRLTALTATLALLGASGATNPTGDVELRVDVAHV